jgi:hypothetical protein
MTKDLAWRIMRQVAKNITAENLNLGRWATRDPKKPGLFESTNDQYYAATPACGTPPIPIVERRADYVRREAGLTSGWWMVCPRPKVLVANLKIDGDNNNYPTACGIGFEIRGDSKTIGSTGVAQSVTFTSRDA